MLQIPSVSLFKGSGDQLFRRFTTGLKIWWFLKLFSVETAESFGVRHQRSHKLPGGGAVQLQCYYCSWSHLDRLNPSIHAFYPAWNFLSTNMAINFNLTSIEMIFSRIPLTPCRFAFPSLRLPQSGVVTQGGIRLLDQTTVSVSRLTEWDHLTFIFIFRHLDSFSYNISIKLFVSVVPPTIGQEILNMGVLILPPVLTPR